MDVSQGDGTDVVKVRVTKRGTWRTASRRVSRITLKIEYDALRLVCEFVSNFFRILRQLCPMGKCHASARWTSRISVGLDDVDIVSRIVIIV
jgi:hypothetical protein